MTTKTFTIKDIYKQLAGKPKLQQLNIIKQASIDHGLSQSVILASGGAMYEAGYDTQLKTLHLERE